MILNLFVMPIYSSDSTKLRIIKHFGEHFAATIFNATLTAFKKNLGIFVCIFDAIEFKTIRP
ncbi:hypothetical protein CO230_02370 [Chryseobacterium sp. 6424]|nr:hypothetical protein CO230_02370 [Chryseobacterium sp. 6424]